MATKWVKVPADAYGYRAPEWTNQIKNMPEVNCSDYDKFDLWIVDDVDRGPNCQGGAGSSNSVHHESLCNAVHHVFSNVFTDCTVHSLRMQPGEREEDFTRRIDTILGQYTSRDLVAFYYHGKAGETDNDYTWRFRGPGPKQINAYDFIRQVNRSDTDCYLILDCFIPTNFPKKWMRKKAMTEFSIAGYQMRDDHDSDSGGDDDGSDDGGESGNEDGGGLGDDNDGDDEGGGGGRPGGRGGQRPRHDDNDENGDPRGHTSQDSVAHSSNGSALLHHQAKADLSRDPDPAHLSSTASKGLTALSVHGVRAWSNEKDTLLQKSRSSVAGQLLATLT